MKKFLKILGFIVLGMLLVALGTYAFLNFKWESQSKNALALLGAEAPIIQVDNLDFRDLNKNGQLDTYEDFRLGVEDRVDDLVAQMNDEEKAGLLFINMILLGKDGDIQEIPSLSNPFSLMLENTSSQLAEKHMNHFNILMADNAADLISWHNKIQKMAERTRLGIPVTIASDPRHGKEINIGAGLSTRFFSYWPSPLGMGAIGDSSLIREFGDIARQEYLATGIRWALHPMADLATEPRWARVNGTFGEDARLSAKLTEAYVLGFQGDSLSNSSVGCMTKHFSGGGPQEDGWDAHFASGKGQVYPGNNFEYHLIPFTDGAFPAKTAAIMPYYGIPKGITSEDVGYAYNKEMITDLLRDSLGYEGIICTDWGLITDRMIKEASAWGVEELSEKERALKIFNVGCDMYGGESRTDLILELIKDGSISQTRLDESVKRILRNKFVLGLFDDPYLAEENIDIFDNSVFKAKGEEAQRKSMVLLKNEESILPLTEKTKVYLEGLDAAAFSAYAEVVDKVEDAEVIIHKFAAPFSPPKGGGFLERMFHQGRLDFPEEEKQEKLALMAQKPTITVLSIDRPPVVPEINAASKAVIADFECQDEIIAELIFGQFNPSGKLPIEIPSSAEAVQNQMEDVPYDSEAPLYKYGHGLSFN